ncbi:FG-GAP repeat domain-containing protein [Sorangium sp. So ce1078]|uniref:FG-GAP repeat domain-containing protein n=1 Tax=Sorangium sp. So ce1078 TaxID=3133329 RepID=UPI003F5FD2AF
MPDIAIATDLDNVVDVLINQGDGTFAPKDGYLVVSSATALAAADLNGDGMLDLIATYDSYGSFVTVLANQGDGTFAARLDYGVSTDMSRHSRLAVGAADLNGDGMLDLAVAGVDGIVSVLVATCLP